MSRPVPLLKHVATARVRPGVGPAFQHGLGQLSLFADAAEAVAAPDASAAPCLDLVDEQRRQEDAWRARQDLLRDAQLHLAAQRLWGFPNMVRNPDGPRQNLRAQAYGLHTSRGCWPTYYLVRVGADDIQRVTIYVRPGWRRSTSSPALPCTPGTRRPDTSISRLPRAYEAHCPQRRPARISPGHPPSCAASPPPAYR